MEKNEIITISSQDWFGARGTQHAAREKKKRDKEKPEKEKAEKAKTPGGSISSPLLSSFFPSSGTRKRAREDDWDLTTEQALELHTYYTLEDADRLPPPPRRPERSLSSVLQIDSRRDQPSNRSTLTQALLSTVDFVRTLHEKPEAHEEVLPPPSSLSPFLISLPLLVRS